MEWYSSQNGRNDTVHEVDLQASNSGQFPVADIKGSGAPSHWLEDFWWLCELNANCRKQRVTSPDYVNPTAVIESSE